MNCCKGYSKCPGHGPGFIRKDNRKVKLIFWVRSCLKLFNTELSTGFSNARASLTLFLLLNSTVSQGSHSCGNGLEAKVLEALNEEAKVLPCNITMLGIFLKKCIKLFKLLALDLMCCWTRLRLPRR